ncbi:hypothetical protein [Fischerella sp. JS2]|nr:hypothetical protein [Fischerella sp. JS2]
MWFPKSLAFSGLLNNVSNTQIKGVDAKALTETNDLFPPLRLLLNST